MYVLRKIIEDPYNRAGTVLDGVLRFMNRVIIFRSYNFLFRVMSPVPLWRGVGLPPRTGIYQAFAIRIQVMHLEFRPNVANGREETLGMGGLFLKYGISRFNESESCRMIKGISTERQL